MSASCHIFIGQCLRTFDPIQYTQRFLRKHKKVYLKKVGVRQTKARYSGSMHDSM